MLIHNPNSGPTHKRDFLERAAIAAMQALLAVSTDNSGAVANYAVECAAALWRAIEDASTAEQKKPSTERRNYATES